MDYLIFQLYGPLASWGTPAVGEARPTSDHPGRSALIGIVAAALGIRRDDAAAQQSLAEAVVFGVKQITPGSFIRDFHTVQVPKRNRNRQYLTRKEEMGFSSDRLNTIISRREYRCDGLWYVAVSLSSQSDWSLEDIAEALRCPVFTPYLGRKSCPLAAPLAPRIVQNTGGLAEAFSEGFPDFFPGQARYLGTGEMVDYFWEGEAADVAVQDTRFPEDDVVSRDRWQFRGRAEYHARIKEAV
ncbi:type I-E CRISPR-associated protein Cas5/CasD [Hydrocarboniclastica marina]|uniref:Type I-E CRISPR-associated protein Cas5/CasD n=1 Tax=Hydrocarboniclastica marina TaxID=2259620 RepID=A0A4P7XM29_9ALTE|nr:type I-E CRISPR-associated protein Cas5/CasD [Hydrocarboniclastica marina]QCF27512.1 type I-E CRISPR-associated protein Cas5/CasD [Hydrocarboniclastica marina]